ncbi:hypothetical protein WID27_08950 [Streptomyces sp. F41]|nr:hypothetical protein [Streptomyces nanshensis]
MVEVVLRQVQASLYQVIGEVGEVVEALERFGEVSAAGRKAVSPPP